MSQKEDCKFELDESMDLEENCTMDLELLLLIWRRSQFIWSSSCQVIRIVQEIIISTNSKELLTRINGCLTDLPPYKLIIILDNQHHNETFLYNFQISSALSSEVDDREIKPVKLS